MNTTNSAADEETALIYHPGPAAESGGLKATWHLEIVTGKEACALLELQNQAILDLLTWAADHEKPTRQNASDQRDIGVNDSRETLELAA